MLTLGEKCDLQLWILPCSLPFKQTHLAAILSTSWIQFKNSNLLTHIEIKNVELVLTTRTLVIMFIFVFTVSRLL